MEAARRTFDELAARAAALGLPYTRFQLSLLESSLAAMVGDLARAEAAADAGLSVANAAGIAAGMSIYGGQLFMLRFMQGRADELAEFLIEMSAAMPAIEPLRVVVLVLLVELGDLELAAEKLAQERAHGFTSYGSGEGRLSILGDLADVAVDLRELDAAGELLELLAPFASQMTYLNAVAPRPVARGVARLAGVLGRHVEAEHAFETAIELCARFGEVYWAGRTHVERAQMYARQGAAGDRERAERDLDAALEFAARCQGVSIERRVERVRAELG